MYETLQVFNNAFNLEKCNLISYTIFSQFTKFDHKKYTCVKCVLPTNCHIIIADNVVFTAEGKQFSLYRL